MFDRNGTLLAYPTETELLALLQGDHVNPSLSECFYTAMLVDAASHGWNKAIEYMVKECDFEVNAYDHKNYTPLGYAAMKGRTFRPCSVSWSTGPTSSTCVTTPDRASLVRGCLRVLPRSTSLWRVATKKWCATC